MANTKSSIPQSVNSIEYTNPVDVLTSKIFNVFDVFKGQLDNKDNIQIVSLLISLYKDGIINQELLSNDFAISKLNKYILESDLKESHKKSYLSIAQMLSDNLTKVICNRNSYLGLYLFNIERDLLVTYFPAAFDDTIYRIAQSQGKYAAEYFQPVELTRFLSKIVTLKENAKVFNPFAGIASFGINLEKNQSYFAQEINQKIWTLGVLRLMAYDRLEDSNYERADSLYEWPNDSKFDLIVSNPPLGMRIDIRDSINNIQFKNAEQFLIEKGIQSLNVNGKLVAVFSLGILYKGGSELELRKKLVDENLIETIISFPGGLFQNTAIPFIVMVLSQDKKLNNKVRFIKADNYVVEKNRREKMLHDELLLNVYNSVVDFSDDIRLIDNEVLRKNDYNLIVNRYFDVSKEETIIPDGFRIVKLEDLVTINRGERTDLQNGRLVKISDLCMDAFNYEKSSNDFEINPLPSVCQQIESDVLILSKIRALKPTLIRCNQNDPIFINNNVVALSFNRSKIDIGYLVYELNSERVQQYVINRMSGITIPTISVKDLLNAPILLPDLATQRNIVNKALNDYQDAKIKKLGIELDELKYSLKQEYEKKIRFRKHAIGQEIFDLTNTFNLITKVKKINNGHLFDDTIINPTTNTTIKSCFQNMSQTINSIREMVDNIAEDYFYGKDEEVDVISFLQKYCNENNGVNFTMELTHDYYIAQEDEYIPDLLESYDENGNLVSLEQTGNILIAKKGEVVSPPRIRISPLSFKQILSNLRNNAIKHGFIDENRQDYKILIDVTKDEKGNVLVSVSNNGAPLKKDMTVDSFFINDRQGNVEIKNRVEHANGKITLDANLGDEYPVRIVMSFKDNSIIATF